MWVFPMSTTRSMSPDDVEAQAKALWVAEIERRAREVAEGKVALIDAAEVHTEADLLHKSAPHN